MSDKIYIGSRLSDLDIGESSLPISKIILNVDSEKHYVAGDDTGLTVEQDCPWASQAMADSVLAKMKGFVYKPFNGIDALLDPAAELGDALTVGGHYGVMSQMGRNLDRMSVATVGAPGVDEIEDEYPYKTKQRRQSDRVLAKTRSLISKTATEIRLMVEEEVGELSENYTELKVTLDGVTITDPTGETKIKGSSIETDTLYVNAANISGTLTAGTLQGNTVALLDNWGNLAGTLDLSTGSTVNYAVDWTSNSGFRLTAVESTYIQAGNMGIYMDVSDSAMPGIKLVSCEYFAPIGSASKLGHPNYGLWDSVYAYTGEIQTSDRNLKNSIEELPDKYVAMLDMVVPCRFKMNNGTSGRYHVGFIAQDVKAAMDANGIDSTEFGGWAKDVDADGNEIQMLRYEEYIAILHAKLRQHDKRLAELEAKA